MSETRQFLCALFDKAQGFISVWCLPSRQTRFFSVSDLDGAENYIQTVGTSSDVYVGLATRTEALGPMQRGKKKHIATLGCVWVDIDIAGPGHAAQNLPTSVGDAADLLDEAFPDTPPSMIIHSGGGLHVYWWLDDPLVIHPTKDAHASINVAEGAVRIVQGRLVAAALQKGWHVDMLPDITRVLRVPGTVNLKDPKNPRPVSLLDDSGVRYSLAQLGGASVPARASVPVPTGSTAPSTGSVGEQTGQASPPIASSSSQPVTFTNTDLVEVITRLKRLRKKRQDVDDLIAGKAFAAPGGRDAALQALASVVGFVAPDTDPALLATLFAPSLAAMALQANDPQNPAPTVADAEAKLRRAQEDKRAEAEQNQRVSDGLKRALQKDARSSARPDNNLIVADETGEYTEAELQRIAGSHGVTVDGLKQRWVIQHGASYYVLVNGEYKTPVNEKGLNMSLPRDLACAPINWTTFTGGGNPRRKTAGEVALEHGSYARHVVASFSIERSYYDPASETFYERVAPRNVSIKPAFHADIHTWLELLGGPMKDKLLDWVATVSRLDLPNSALYLSGEPNTGKTLLANGLAQIWGTQPVELDVLLDSDFNSELERCPLVFADEHISNKKNHTTAELRRMVSAPSRPLKRKHLPNAELRGYLRLILAANNEDMLNLGDEELSGSDLDAFAGRFLHIKVGKAPALFLKSLNGKPQDEGWVPDGLIAAHALWLLETRAVPRGDRFLVEGDTKDLAMDLMLESKTAGLVAEWVARYLDDPKHSIIRPGTVQVGNGVIRVNTTTVVEYWDLYVKSHPVPSTTRVGRTLRQLAGGTGGIKIGTRTFHEVKPDVIYRWAEHNHVGDVDGMRDKVERRRETDGDGNIVDAGHDA